MVPVRLPLNYYNVLSAFGRKTMLPDEAEVAGEITIRYSVQLNAMAALHDAVVSMITGGSWTIRKLRGLAPFVAETIVGLLTKACKTFRSIQILCERGLYEDASALVRVLMETTIAIAFILQRKSKERTIIYHAHGMAQQIKMLNHWRSTPGLKRKVTKVLLEHANDALTSYLKKLPVGTDVKHHWSGTRNLQQAMKALRGDVVYATLYRYASSISHASDFGAHFTTDPASGEFVWQIEPQVGGFEAPSYAAR